MPASQPYRIIVKFADDAKYFEDPSHYVAGTLDGLTKAQTMKSSARPDRTKRANTLAQKSIANSCDISAKRPEAQRRDFRDWRVNRLQGWQVIVGNHTWLRSVPGDVSSPSRAIKPLFTSVSPERILELARRAEKMDLQYGGIQEINLLTYFVIDCPDGFTRAEAERFVCDLSHWRVSNDPSSKVLTRAYIDAQSCLPSTTVVLDVIDQPYIYPDEPDAKQIDVSQLWKKKGGAGTNQHFIDLEGGWGPPDDLPNIVLLDAEISGVNPDPEWAEHGTGILGIICAKDDPGKGKGMVGIAHKLALEQQGEPTYAENIRKVSIFTKDIEENRADAILRAVNWLPYGGVLLLEIGVQEKDDSGKPLPGLPVESLPVEFEIIRLGTSLGVIIIEAGGNGGVLFPSAPYPSFGCSGAIMVAAATQDDQNYKRYVGDHKNSGSNYGCRMDCFAIGDGIDTLSNEGDSQTMFGKTYHQ